MGFFFLFCLLLTFFFLFFIRALISPVLNDSIKPVHSVHAGCFAQSLAFIKVSETHCKLIRREDGIIHAREVKIKVALIN